MNTMTISQLVSLIRDKEARDTNHVFFVSFIKKNGDLRNMQCRIGVTKGVKGVLPEGHRKAEDARCNVLTVFDMVAIRKGINGFRRINLEGVQSVSIAGEKFQWDFDAGLLTKV